jgi:formylglycine-generating enzyme required for sulfatase activity/serine/threonine protein kinase
MHKDQIIHLKQGRYQLIEALASGGQGTIWKVLKIKDDQQYALKVVNLYDTRFAVPERHPDDYLQTLIKYATAEIAFLNSLDNEQAQHIALCLDDGWIEEEGVELPAFIMQLYHQDDLKKRIKQHQEGVKVIEAAVWRGWFKQLMLALQSIQTSSTEGKLVAHRDLKPANCLFDAKDNLYLSDFGIVRESSKTGLTSVSRVGTFDFCAPEQCFARYEGSDGIPHYYITLKLDIYSAAMIMHEIVVGSTRAQKSLTETSINQHKQTLYGLDKVSKGKIGKLGTVGGLTSGERDTLQHTLSDLLTPATKKHLTMAFHQPSLPHYPLIANDLTDLIETMLCPWPDDRPDVKAVLHTLAHIEVCLSPILDKLSLSEPHVSVCIGQPLLILFEIDGKGLPELPHWLQISLDDSPLENPQIKHLQAQHYQLALPIFSELISHTLRFSAQINGKTHNEEATIDVTPDADYLWTIDKRLPALQLDLRKTWLDQWEVDATTVYKKHQLQEALKQLQIDYPQQAEVLQQRHERIDGLKKERKPLPLKTIGVAIAVLAIGTLIVIKWPNLTQQTPLQDDNKAISSDAQIKEIAKLIDTSPPKSTLPDISSIKIALSADKLKNRQQAWQQLQQIIAKHKDHKKAISLKKDYEQQTLVWNKKGADKDRRKEALRRLQVLAQAGDGNAQYWLALRYLDGDGVKKDTQKGKQWVEKAGDQGIENAKQTLNYFNDNNTVGRVSLSSLRDNVTRQNSKENKSFEPKMVAIKAGSFKMGCVSGKDCYDNEKPVHSVTVNAFELAITEVTFDQWDACVKAKGCSHKPKDEGWGRGKRPVIHVSWNDTQQYIKWLNKETGKHYRLPSEAEWEYAARAGTNTKYWWGNKNPSCHKKDKNGASFDGGEKSDCYYNPNNKYRGTEEVAHYSANPWGLYDLHGNLWEWVQDRYQDTYKKPPSDGSAWESAGASRVLRGGSWNNAPRNLRSANRFRNTPDYRNSLIGFRLARSQ